MNSLGNKLVCNTKIYIGYKISISTIEKGSTKWNMCKESYHPKCKKFHTLDIETKWKIYQIKFCRSKEIWGIKECKNIHHNILHNEERINNESELEKNIHVLPTTENVDLLRILPVALQGPNNKSLKIYAILDERSTVTLLE